MKKLILFCFLLIVSSSAYAQYIAKELSDYLIYAVNASSNGFMNDSLVLKAIPMNNAVIRPISINYSQDTMFFSMEINVTPIELKNLKLAGLKHIGSSKTLFIQQNHQYNDFTRLDWEKNQQAIDYYVDSLFKNTSLLDWEPHPLVAFCMLYKRKYKNTEDDFSIELEVEYYLNRNSMPLEYFPIEEYPEGLKVDIYKYVYNFEFYSILPWEFINIISFKRLYHFPPYPKWQ